MYKLKLANIMGMDIDKAQHGVGIADALCGIKNQQEFIEYCRENKDKIEYANRVEKLDQMATTYKNTINNIPTEKLEIICHDIANKFKTATQMLRDNEEVFDGHLERLKSDGVQYFMNKEIELMNSVGGLNRLLFLYELGTLYESLYDKSIKLVILKNTNAQLTDGQKRIQVVIGGRG